MKSRILSALVLAVASLWFCSTSHAGILITIDAIAGDSTAFSWSLSGTVNSPGSGSANVYDPRGELGENFVNSAIQSALASGAGTVTNDTRGTSANIIGFNFFTGSRDTVRIVTDVSQPFFNGDVYTFNGSGTAAISSGSFSDLVPGTYTGLSPFGGTAAADQTTFVIASGAVPEPSSALCFAIGLLAVSVLPRRSKS